MTFKQAIKNYRGKIAKLQIDLTFTKHESIENTVHEIKVLQRKIERIEAMAKFPPRARYLLQEKYEINKRLKNSKRLGWDDFSFKYALNRMNYIFFMGIPEKILSLDEEIECRLKYARITYKGKNGYITFVDNQTMIAYRMKGEDEHFYNGIKKPLEPISEPWTFERWCTGMDL